MSAAVRIRRALPDDAVAILDLERLFPGDRMSRASVRRFLRIPQAAVWVATQRAAVVGALILLGRRDSAWARIYSVVVDPALRGRGLGQRLVRAAEREARRRGACGVSLEVRADNAAARALYARLGYAQAALLHAYYEDGAPGIRLKRHFVG